MVPHWARGTEMASITSPIARDLHLLALGGSRRDAASGGITAPVVVVHNWDELDAKARAGQRRDRRLRRARCPRGPKSTARATARPCSTAAHGASRAAKYGAVAALVRSVTARSLRRPTPARCATTTTSPKIPTASISVEDAELLDRLADKGPVIDLPAARHADASRRRIGERDRRAARQRAPRRVRRDRRAPRLVGRRPGRARRRRRRRHDDADAADAEGARPHAAPHDPRRAVHERGERPARRQGLRRPTTRPSCRKTVLALEADSGGFAPRGFEVAHKDAEAAKRASARASPTSRRCCTRSARRASKRAAVAVPTSARCRRPACPRSVSTSTAACTSTITTPRPTRSTR